MPDRGRVVSAVRGEPDGQRVRASAGSRQRRGGAGDLVHAPSHTGSVHKAIDEASNTLTSPFAGVTAGSTSQWAIRGANLLLALVVYGFGLGFLARLIAVRH
jgi:hypothetical protein